jgi:hypothetical protein
LLDTSEEVVSDREDDVEISGTFFYMGVHLPIVKKKKGSP